MTTVQSPSREAAPDLPLATTPTALRVRWRRLLRPTLLPVWLAIALAVFARFFCPSALWLDEAQTVALARRPIGQFAASLRHDGSPPLYYLLLHVWIRLFGSTGGSVRALSALLSVVAIPVCWAVTRKIANGAAAVAAAVLMASSPFAVFLAGETRMYSLVVTLTLVGAWALLGVLGRPTWPRAGLLAGVTTALLLTHYWTLFLVACTLAALGVAVLRRDLSRRPCLFAVGAIGVGVALFVPWYPIMLFQQRHTGTPWAAPPRVSTLSSLFLDWSAPAQSSRFQGLPTSSAALVLPLAGLLGLLVVRALVGVRRAQLTERRLSAAARVLAAIAAATLLVAACGSVIGHGGYEPRYTAPMFALMIIVAGIGAALLPRAHRVAVLVVMCVAGLASSIFAQSLPSKTQAGMISAAIRSSARPGDVIVYCPDQLAPAVSRLVPATMRQLAFPVGALVSTVDWVDYAQRNRAASPGRFAATVQRAARNATIWLVDVPHGYATYGDKCREVQRILSDRRVVRRLVVAQPHRYYEFGNLLELMPARTSS